MTSGTVIKDMISTESTCYLVYLAHPHTSHVTSHLSTQPSCSVLLLDDPNQCYVLVLNKRFHAQSNATCYAMVLTNNSPCSSNMQMINMLWFTTLILPSPFHPLSIFHFIVYTCNPSLSLLLCWELQMDLPQSSWSLDTCTCLW